MDVTERLHLSHGRRPTDRYPLAIINVTNRCNLHCEHCFVYRDGNPNESQSPRLEMSASEIVETLTFLKDRHGISLMLWMGGEPLLRKDVLAPGLNCLTETSSPQMALFHSWISVRMSST